MSSFKSYVIEVPNGDLKCKEKSLEQAKIPENGALVKVLFAGVCHTDIHYCEGEYKLSETEKAQFFNRPGYKFPKVPGHEVCGEVVTLGSNVPSSSCDVSVGDRVCIFSWMGCGECQYCADGSTDCCQVLLRRELGMTYDGGYAQFVLVPDYRSLLPTPANISSELACTLSCGCLTAYNACNTAIDNIPNSILQSSTDLNIAIIGLGGLGQWCLKLLPLLMKTKGYLKSVRLFITGMDVSEERLDVHFKNDLIAEKFVIDRSKSAIQVADEILSSTNGIGAPYHAVIDFVNNPLTFTASNRVMRPHGVLVGVGLFGGAGEVRLPLLALKRQKIIGVQTGSLRSFRELLDFVEEQGTGFEGPAIDVYPLEECNQVIQNLKNGKIRGRAILKCN